MACLEMVYRVSAIRLLLPRVNNEIFGAQLYQR